MGLLEAMVSAHVYIRTRTTLAENLQPAARWLRRQALQREAELRQAQQPVSQEGGLGESCRPSEPPLNLLLQRRQ